MDYVSERITNISELEALINESYIIAQLMQKESPHNENFRKLIENLQKASNFEFHIERRKTSYCE